MKKVAVTVAVLALGLAACQPKAENNGANETAVENAASNDVNAAENATAAAENELNAAGNAVENAGNASANTPANATENK